jgi:hypothetical protein
MRLVLLLAALVAALAISAGILLLRDGEKEDFR